MAQNVLRYNVVIVGKFFNKGSWVSDVWRRSTQKNGKRKLKANQKESQRQQSEENGWDLTMTLWAPCVCGLWARHLHAAFG